MATKIRVAGYTRVSTQMQVGGNFASLDAQANMIRGWVSTHPDCELVEIFEDAGRSGKDMNRPAIRKLMSRVQKGDIDMVVSYRLDRVSRDNFSYYEFEKLLDQYNVRIHYTNDINTDRSPGGLLIKDVNLAVGAYERRQSSQRVKDKYDETVRAGYYPAGMPPIGYKRGREKKTIVEDKTCSHHIRFIFEQFITGQKPFEIALELVKKGWQIPAKKTLAKKAKYGDRPYNENKIRKILRNPTYAGYVCLHNRKTHEPELHEGRHKALIARDDWYKAQSLLNQATQEKKGTTIRQRNPYLLKGMLFCGCGAHMTTAASSKKHADGTPYHYYICTNKIHNRGTCTCKTAIAEEILDSVIVSALAYIGGKDVTAAEIKSSVDDYKAEITRELESLKPKQYNLEVEVKKAMERFATIADDTLANVAASIATEKNKELKLVKERIDQIEAELAVLDKGIDLSNTQLKASINNLGVLHDQIPRAEKLELVKAVISKVELSVIKYDVHKRSLRVVITPTADFMGILGERFVVEFDVDNSRGKGYWRITSPFVAICDESRQPHIANRSEYGRHFIHDVVKWQRLVDSNDYTIREAAEILNVKRGMLGRKLSLLKRLSADALEYLLKVKVKSTAEKLTFVTVERISLLPSHTHLMKLKKVTKEK